jgi:hypothetical protein
MSNPRFGCKTCGKEVKPVDGRLICCGYDEGVPVKREFGNRNLRGDLHGVQPQIGTGEVHYEHGALTYLDDGNGNVYDADAEDWED